MSGETHIPWQEEQSLSAGIIRDYRRAIYIAPAGETAGVLVVESTSKAFAVPPVFGTQQPRPTGMVTYCNNNFYIGFGARRASTPALAADEPFYRASVDTMGGWVPGGEMWKFPLHPSVSTVFVFAQANTGELRASWIYGR